MILLSIWWWLTSVCYINSDFGFNLLIFTYMIMRWDDDWANHCPNFSSDFIVFSFQSHIWVNRMTLCGELFAFRKVWSAFFLHIYLVDGTIEAERNKFLGESSIFTQISAKQMVFNINIIYTVSFVQKKIFCSENEVASGGIVHARQEKFFWKWVKRESFEEREKNPERNSRKTRRNWRTKNETFKKEWENL